MEKFVAHVTSVLKADLESGDTERALLALDYCGIAKAAPIRDLVVGALKTPALFDKASLLILKSPDEYRGLSSAIQAAAEKVGDLRLMSQFGDDANSAQLLKWLSSADGGDRDTCLENLVRPGLCSKLVGLAEFYMGNSSAERTKDLAQLVLALNGRKMPQEVAKLFVSPPLRGETAFRNVASFCRANRCVELETALRQALERNDTASRWRQLSASILTEWRLPLVGASALIESIGEISPELDTMLASAQIQQWPTPALLSTFFEGALKSANKDGAIFPHAFFARCCVECPQLTSLMEEMDFAGVSEEICARLAAAVGYVGGKGRKFNTGSGLPDAFWRALVPALSGNAANESEFAYYATLALKTETVSLSTVELYRKALQFWPSSAAKFDEQINEWCALQEMSIIPPVKWVLEKAQASGSDISLPALRLFAATGDEWARSVASAAKVSIQTLFGCRPSAVTLTGNGEKNDEIRRMLYGIAEKGTLCGPLVRREDAFELYEVAGPFLSAPGVDLISTRSGYLLWQSYPGGKGRIIERFPMRRYVPIRLQAEGKSVWLTVESRSKPGKDFSKVREGEWCKSISMAGAEFLDEDGDGLSIRAEHRLGTDPLNADSDGDGLLDGEDPCPLVARGALFAPFVIAVSIQFGLRFPDALLPGGSPVYRLHSPPLLTAIPYGVISYEKSGTRLPSFEETPGGGLRFVVTRLGARILMEVDSQGIPKR
ncbi:MAG: hypothetical protein WC712_03645 [Candidatus Brocadiia bacterium]